MFVKKTMVDILNVYFGLKLVKILVQGGNNKKD